MYTPLDSKRTLSFVSNETHIHKNDIHRYDKHLKKCRSKFINNRMGLINSDDDSKMQRLIAHCRATKLKWPVNLHINKLKRYVTERNTGFSLLLYKSYNKWTVSPYKIYKEHRNLWLIRKDLWCTACQTRGLLVHTYRQQNIDSRYIHAW